MKTHKDDMLGTMGIGKLLAKLSIPAMIGMIVNALYNIVDTIYIGRGVGSLAIGGLTISFPFQMIVMAIGMQHRLYPEISVLVTGTKHFDRREEAFLQLL